MLNVSSTTRLFGVLGDPIGHSKSPVMMNCAFAETGYNGVYSAFHVKPERLREAVNGMLALGYRGANITIPHKVEVMSLIDEIHPDALAAGAVNTIVNEDGRWIGFNTDGIGYVRSLLEETRAKLSGARIVLIGAGGAAKGIAHALASHGPDRVIIANRTKDKADQLAKELSGKADVQGIAMEQLKEPLLEADIVVNTTSVGMHPNVDDMPVDPLWIRSGCIVSDLIYNPRETRLLTEAEARGCTIHGGLGMFIYQGAYAFEYWTGIAAPVQQMRSCVEQALQQ